ncbi:ECF transporter S component [Alicyclobacillus sp.]|uniref:ECF transporter S component n=1 Tax=Alicyclobacillus sp. TaxID=61169 RepID=UPI0025C49842|nr:ECF transporter S component [Alicyclobacillus sp.]MCL6516268.1 ECF transporter S component [Alicyclobacillus sp.]
MSGRALAAVAGVAALGVVIAGAWWGWPWYATATAALVLGAWSVLELYERYAADPKYIALVATLSALASVGRAAMQGIPGVQPATFLVLASGFSLGPVTGAAVGAFTAVGSNLFLGEGGWTPWQMAAWGLAGASAGWLRRFWPRLTWRALMPFGVLWGYLFGWILNTWSLLGTGHPSWPAYLALCGLSVWFDTLHALANALFAAAAGRPTLSVLDRFRRRLMPADAQFNLGEERSR